MNLLKAESSALERHFVLFDFQSQQRHRTIKQTFANQYHLHWSASIGQLIELNTQIERAQSMADWL